MVVLGGTRASIEELHCSRWQASLQLLGSSPNLVQEPLNSPELALIPMNEAIVVPLWAWMVWSLVVCCSATVCSHLILKVFKFIASRALSTAQNFIMLHSLTYIRYIMK
jgi:hypothetical protein